MFSKLELTSSGEDNGSEGHICQVVDEGSSVCEVHTGGCVGICDEICLVCINEGHSTSCPGGDYLTAWILFCTHKCWYSVENITLEMLRSKAVLELTASAHDYALGLITV